MVREVIDLKMTLLPPFVYWRTLASRNDLPVDQSEGIDLDLVMQSWKGLVGGSPRAR
jgi:hypothetical protein